MNKLVGIPLESFTRLDYANLGSFSFVALSGRSLVDYTFRGCVQVYIFTESDLDPLLIWSTT